MARSVVLFAREPAAQAREKGLDPRGSSLFRAFAAGWIEAARASGATPIVAAPPEDLASWRRALAAPRDVVWIPQRGGNLGEKLEDSARQAALRGGPAVFVGGDVRPSPTMLASAFEALEAGADAVLCPAPDGGVSLLALAETDTDLLGPIRPRRRTLFRDLLLALRERGRIVEVLDAVADLDGRSGLRTLFRVLPAADSLRPLLRSVLGGRAPSAPDWLPLLASRLLTAPCGLRAPPLSLDS